MDSFVCEKCGHVNGGKADRVSIHGMYDGHLFHKYTGASVDEVIDNWLDHISRPIPATIRSQGHVEDLGPTSLCPAIVLAGKKELRRVGKMVHVDYKTRKPCDPGALEAYRLALKADPDISRLLSDDDRRE